jgi:F0F1-type ATP synthase membrane subunit c/vacuolar-type H+-ATPase subunit K
LVTFTSALLAFVSWILYSYGNAGKAPAGDVVTSAGINMGLAGLFTALGQAAVGQSHAKDVLIDGKNFGRQLISIINCEAPILFSFIVAFISYAGSSSHSNIPLANLVMAAFSVTALAYGLLSARIPPKEFRRRLGLGAVPGYVAFAGLLLALYLIGVF